MTLTFKILFSQVVVSWFITVVIVSFENRGAVPFALQIVRGISAASGIVGLVALMLVAVWGI